MRAAVFAMARGWQLSIFSSPKPPATGFSFDGRNGGVAQNDLGRFVRHGAARLLNCPHGVHVLVDAALSKAGFANAGSVFLIAQEKERGRADDAYNKHDFVIADEIGINHQTEAEQHRFPEIHSLSVDEGDETDRPKHKSAD